MAAELIGNVNVDGRWYGPAHGATVVGEGVPEEVAAQITNPAAWAGGVLPEGVALPVDDPRPELKPEAPPKAESGRRRSTSKD